MKFSPVGRRKASLTERSGYDFICDLWQRERLSIMRSICVQRTSSVVMAFLRLPSDAVLWTQLENLGRSLRT